MSRVSSTIRPAFLGVLVLFAVSGCRVHVRGKHHYHQHHVHRSTRPKTRVVHRHSTSSTKTTVQIKNVQSGASVEYDLHDDAVPPPVEASSSVSTHPGTNPAPPPAHTPPGLAKKGGVPPGLAKKESEGVPPGQAKKHAETIPPGQAKKKKKHKKWK